MPGPGPEAAPPPPWHRVPGTIRVRHGEGHRPGTAGGLLGDGPTDVMGTDHGGQRVSSRPSGQGRPRAAGRPCAPPATTPRQAALQLKRLDPWSVLKLSLVLAVVLFLVWLVAVGVLYGVLTGWASGTA